MPIDGTDKLRGRLDAMKARMRDQTPAMKVIGEEVVLRTVNAFRAQQSPAGDDWADLADSTIQARAAKLPGASRRSKGVTTHQKGKLRGLGVSDDIIGRTGRLTAGARKKRATAILGHALGAGGITPLIDTGRLRASAGRYKAGPKSVTWSVVGYGGYHMTGSLKRPGRPPKRNFAVFERTAGGKWTAIPAMDRFARETISRFVLTGALK